MEDLGGTGGGVIGGKISHVQYLTVGGRQGEEGCPISMDRSGRERRQIDRRAVWEEAYEFAAGTAKATVTETATNANDY